MTREPNENESGEGTAATLTVPGGRCWRCGDPRERLLHAHQRRPVCNQCFLALFDELLSDDDGDDDWEEVMSMSETELDAELKASGVDVPAFIARVKERIAKADKEQP